MGTNRSLKSGFDVAQQHVPVPILVIAGPLLGLGIYYLFSPLLVLLPLLHQNKLLERTAIGRHCFEVSHGKNRPCDSSECECPVRKVLETNEKVSVTHYHENPLEGKGRQRLVKVLASPVRDSQGNVIRVAELIWDAGRVN